MTRRKKMIIALTAVVLVVCGFLTFQIGGYYWYVDPQKYGEGFAMDPLSRQVFQIDAQQVERIRIRNKTDRFPDQRWVEDKEKIQEIVDKLNSFRYLLWTPGPSYRDLPMGCCPYNVVVYYEMGPGYQVRATGCTLEENRLLMEGLCFYGPPGAHQELLNDI